MRDGLTGTGRSGSASGASSETSASPHHASGSAPRTPAAARRASSAAAALADFGADVAGSHTAARSSATSPPRCTPRCGARERAIAVDRVEFVEEPGRLLLVAGDRGDDELATGPGRGDVEEPALLGELRRRGRAGCIAPGEDVDEQFRTEQRAAPAQIRPAALLHLRDADEIPLETLARVRGEHGDRLGSRGCPWTARRPGSAAPPGARRTGRPAHRAAGR